jgi:hypothetical protein
MRSSLAIFLCGCVSATAQAPQSKSAGSSLRNEQPAPGRGIITRQPPVLGDNISQVIDRLILAGGSKGKDEFETTEQYEARRKAGAAKNGTLVFVLPPDAPGLIYNADAQEMKIYLRTSHTFFDDDGGLNSGNTFVIRSTLVSKGPYVGTNAFGVKRLIQSTVSKDRGLFVDPASPVRLKEFSPPSRFPWTPKTRDCRNPSCAWRWLAS